MEATGLEGRCTWRRDGWIHGGEGRRLARATMEWGERVAAVVAEKKRAKRRCSGGAYSGDAK
jgi:hypothetical protein